MFGCFVHRIQRVYLAAGHRLEMADRLLDSGKLRGAMPPDFWEGQWSVKTGQHDEPEPLLWNTELGKVDDASTYVVASFKKSLT
jgi:hypothetical protein